MVFENPEMLMLLLIIPLVFLLGIFGQVRRRRQAAVFAGCETWEKIRPYRSKSRRRFRFALLLCGLTLIAFAAAGPKFGASFEKVSRKGLDVVIAIDTSDSMLAQDMQPSRLAFAKGEVDRILKRIKGDRVALLPFAGEAYLLCPLTLDYSAVRMFLGVVDEQIIPTGGTGIANAIDAERATFNETERNFRVMILLTDGEDLLGKALESAKKAQEDGVVVFILGIGTADGVPIPTLDAQGNVSYKKDRTGQVVISKINETTLSKIARETGGIYAKATYDDSAVDAIFAKLDKLQRKEMEGKLVTRYKSRYQWFLIPGMILAALGMAVGQRKTATWLGARKSDPQSLKDQKS